MTSTVIRSLLLGTLLFSTIATTLAQEPTEAPMRTVFGGTGPMHHGGWGAPMAAYTTIMDQSAMLVGARGGWLIDHHLTLGLAGYGLVTPVENHAYDAYLISTGSQPTDNSRFQTGYGGLLIEPIIAYQSPVHISLPIMIGAGGCGYQTYRPLPADFDPLHYDGDDHQAFFVAEAGVELELNLVRMVRLGIGGSYRYTSDIKLPAMEKDALNGFNASVSVKVGVF